MAFCSCLLHRQGQELQAIESAVRFKRPGQSGNRVVAEVALRPADNLGMGVVEYTILQCIEAP